MPWKLLPPGKRGPFWYVRGTTLGRRYEVSTGTTDEVAARTFAERHSIELTEAVEHDRNDPDRAIPRPRPLGRFEKFLQSRFRLVDGKVVGPNGMPPSARPNPLRGNYVQIQVWFDKGVRRCYAHRLAFLLAHGWLPEIVDHIDGDPLNNHPDNLRASTPLLNAQHRPKLGASPSVCLKNGGKPR